MKYQRTNNSPAVLAEKQAAHDFVAQAAGAPGDLVESTRQPEPLSVDPFEAPHD